MQLRTFGWLPWLALTALAGAAQAASPAVARAAAAPPTVQAHWSPAVGDGVLAQVRGGFDLGGGLVAAFGIGRTVYINGALVASVRLSIPDLAQVDAAQASALAALAHGVTLVRNGPGNFVNPASFDHSLGAIVIQNSLDNQHIQALTTLDTTVKDLNLFNAMNLANSLQQAGVVARGQ